MINYASERIIPVNLKRIMCTAVFLFFTASALCGCSIGKANEKADNGSYIINGDYGGIAFDITKETVATAISIPRKSGDNADFAVYPEITEDTTLPPMEENEEESEEATESTSAEASVTTAKETTTTEKATTTTAKATTTTAKATTTTTKVVTTTARITTTTTAKSTTITTAETITKTNATTEKTTATTVTTTAEETEGSYSGNTTYGVNSYTALNYKQVKAVWISYIEINNLLQQKSEAEFRKTIGRIYDNCLSLGLNTVYVHVRAFGDAFYYSELYPFTKYISGTLGKKTDYDPLKIMIKEAHNRDISFHAWINPLRLNSATDIASVSESYTVGKWYNGREKGKYIVNVGGTYFLNPAYDEAIKLVGDGVREIVSGYNVDGIHIDDYFYPTTDTSFDSTAYSAFGTGTLSSFRIGRCNKLVKEIYTAVNDCSSTAIFGASTQGNMYNNLTQLYADTESWCKGGYIDYFTPQIYYGFENSGVPFKKCLDDWSELVSGTKVKLYAGLCLYKVGLEDTWAGTGKNEWINNRDILKRQIEYSFEKKGCDGIALYCYNYLFSKGYHNAEIQKEIDNFKNLLK